VDRLSYYRQCVQDLLTEYSRGKPINREVEVETVFDRENDHYLLVNLGWDQHRRLYNCVMHLDIKDKKIWIQRNQTDQQITQELMDMGIPAQDIILGLQPAYARQYTGFGVA